MTITEHLPRVDLFTHIHKALRKGLFDVGVRAGACDWTDSDDVAALATEWRAMADLLRSHSAHEDEFIFRLVDDPSPLPHDDHRDLDDLLSDLDERLDRLALAPDAGAGLAWYRDLMRFVAATLHHLHVEETAVQPALWAARTDQELLDCRAAFLAATPPAVMETTLRLLREAVEPPVRHALGL